MFKEKTGTQKQKFREKDFTLIKLIIVVATIAINNFVNINHSI